MLSSNTEIPDARDDSLAEDRRPLKTRSWSVFQRIAAWLARSGVSPNAISVSSILFAVAGAVGFVLTAWFESSWAVRAAWFMAAVGIQLRLIANLLDGMVAVEGGRASATGPLYNEVPDRISDPILLVAAGYAIASNPTAGWAAASAALMVAYVRAIAASVGVGQLFLGPMAKPQRMAVLTAVAIAGVLLPSDWLVWNVGDWPVGLVEIALWLITLGCVVTVARRLSVAGSFLRTRHEAPPATPENT
ncbi:CDP-alcohol phosphatidyltransferase [Allorhodopirellula solitaria]|uniref:CDP-alcohol phosphatidyltransferase n=2 Tax=Allorhodopirellula solitaria TaxID=2527987 RepID=A0A5C5XWQ6_9BACT|nr:CDP-alcohol phosphatidyltransferase family protein [Allorhodopirellula solitaria]TWT67380.1 CDP-alcohol phosphatidyltransferase [Allorhodopirellula solitaria]